MGVLLTSALYGNQLLLSDQGPCLSARLVRVEEGGKIVSRGLNQDTSFSKDGRQRSKDCVCGDELDRLKRLGKLALQRQNYTKFKDCVGDLAPTAPAEDMDGMMEFLYPPDEANPIVNFKDPRRKVYKPGSRSEPRTLRDEYVFKKTLLVGVLTQQEYLPTRAKVLYETWGKEVDKLILFVGEDCNVSADLMHLPIVKLKGVPDHVYPPLKKAFAVMKYMYTHHINEFNWFIRADDDMYVRTKNLTDLLLQMNPYERVYLGRAGTGRKEDLKRLELLPHERYCMGGPGVILSNGAMRGVGPHLDNCLNAVLHHDAHSDDKWNDDDVEIGRCLSRKLDTQCSSSTESRTLFMFDYTGDTLTPSSLWTDPQLESLITVHPVKDPNNMRSLHHFYKSLEFKQNYDRLRDAVDYINELCRLLPPSVAPPLSASVGCNLQLHPHLSQLNSSVTTYGHLGYTPGGTLRIVHHPPLIHNPKNKFDLLLWTRFNNSQLQDVYDSTPQHFHTPSFRSEMVHVLNMIQSHLQIQFGTKAAQISHVLDGYTRFDPHAGREYLLTVKALTNGNYPQYKKFHLIRQVTPDISLVEEHLSLSTPMIHVILPLSRVNSRFHNFLLSYADVGLRYKENKIHLIVVVFDQSEADTAQKILDDFTKKTFAASVTIITASGADNRLKAVEVAMATLRSGNSLVFLADVDIRFSSGFFRRCRTNAVLNHRVYFPIAFWLYNRPSTFDAHQPPPISPATGEWGYYNFWLACLYKEDYDKIGGYKDSKYTVELFERASASRELEVMQAPDPGLFHLWNLKGCRDLRSSARKELCVRLSQTGVGGVEKPDAADYVGELMSTKKPFQMGKRIT